MKNIPDKTKLIISRRQPKDLKQHVHLTRAKFSTEQEKQTVTKCNEPIDAVHATTFNRQSEVKLKN